MSVDTVFNGEMRPVFVNEPHVVIRRLKAGYPESWTRVCIGGTNQVVTIPEYLYAEKYAEVQKMIRDVLKKSELSMYRRDPSRLDAYIQRAALRMIELISKEK